MPLNRRLNEQAEVYSYSGILFLNMKDKLLICCCSVMSNSLQPQGLYPTRHLCLWDFQARILEWVTISYSRGSSQPRDRTHISCTGRQVLYHWAIREAQTTTNMQHHGIILNILPKWLKPGSKGYILCDSIYMTFQKDKTIGTENRSVVTSGWEWVNYKGLRGNFLRWWNCSVSPL